MPRRMKAGKRSPSAARRPAMSASASSISRPRPIFSGRSASGSARNGLVTPRTRVVIEKPIGHDLESAQRRQRRDRQRVPGEPHLSHRSLSRQGDGAEPDGAALRQCAVRAALERRPYRPCADHGGRDLGRRGPRRLLRHGRRAARHGAEPHAAASLPRRDGAADLDRRRCGARREAESAEIAEADHRRQCAPI